MRGQDFRHGLPVLLGVRGAKDRLRVRHAGIGHAPGQVRPVHDKARAELPAPGGRFQASGRGRNRDAGPGRKLDEHGPDPAGPADHEQALARVGVFCGREPQAVEQAFPGRDARQRQAGDLRRREARRGRADKALIHKLVRGVAAVAGKLAGVEYGLARREPPRLGAAGGHNAPGVPAQDFFLSRREPGKHLGIHRVDADGFDADEDVASFGLGNGPLLFAKGLGIGCGEAACGDDGFHACTPRDRPGRGQPAFP